MEHSGADSILYNANIITLDNHSSIAGAVAVKNGRILAVGASQDMKDFKDGRTEMIDLDQKTVLPGFIEAHTHVDLTGMMTSDFVLDCRIPPLDDNDAVLGNIQAKAQTIPKGELILAHGRWMQPYLSKADLDRIAPDHPVILKYNMHLYLLNSCALRKHGITKEQPAAEKLFEEAPGAQIQRDPLTGTPNGFLEDAWDFLYPGSPSPLSYDETKAGIRHGLDAYTRSGVTSITEFVDYRESPRIYQELLREGRLNARVQLVHCVHGLHRTTDLNALIGAGLATGYGDEWLSFGGAKFFIDLGVETTLSSIQLKEMVGRAHRAGIRVYMHANTRMAQDMALNAIETAEERMPGRDLRHRIEHMGNRLIDMNYFDRVRKTKAIALPTAYFMNIGRNFEKDLKLFLFRTMLDKGLCIPGNSDSGGTEPQAPNPLYQIWCMAARKSRDGGDVYPEEAITVKEGLEIYTRHSAYAALQENIKGTIEPEKLADFAVLSHNPLTCSLNELLDIRTEKTIVGGKVVYDGE
jgi:predicted amidohydrolase YtcJ